MRLFEVDNSRFIDDLETLLRNLVGRGDSKKSPQTLTYPALSSLLKNLGYGDINYDVFSKLYDDNPQLKPLIRNFNTDAIVLGTKAEPASTKTISGKFAPKKEAPPTPMASAPAAAPLAPIQ